MCSFCSRNHLNYNSAWILCSDRMYIYLSTIDVYIQKQPRYTQSLLLPSSTRVRTKIITWFSKWFLKLFPVIFKYFLWYFACFPDLCDFLSVHFSVFFLIVLWFLNDFIFRKLLIIQWFDLCSISNRQVKWNKMNCIGPLYKKLTNRFKKLSMIYYIYKSACSSSLW